MKEGLVSVIIPVLNRPHELREAVASAVGQSWTNLEVVIVDDGSTDDTAAVARELAARDGRIRVLQQENGGPGRARETGRLAAEGEFLQYLDSDDLLLPEKLSLQVERLRARPEAVLTYGSTRHLRGGTIVDCFWKPNGIGIDSIFPATLNNRYWDTPSPLYRAALAAPAGGWSDLRVEEDWEYDCRLGTLLLPIDFIDQEVVVVRHDSAVRQSANGNDRFSLRHRARAHELVLQHAFAAGIPRGSAEMKSFARTLFLLARKCGAAELPEQSARLLALARATATQRSIDMSLYAAVSRVIGLSLTGKTAELIDRMRNRADAGNHLT